MGCQQGKVSKQVNLADKYGKSSQDVPNFDKETQQSTNIAYTTHKGLNQKNNYLIKEVQEEENSSLNSKKLQNNSNSIANNNNNNKSRTSCQIEKNNNISPQNIQIKSMQKIEENIQNQYYNQQFSSTCNIRKQNQQQSQNQQNYNQNNKTQLKYSLSENKAEFSKFQMEDKNNDQIQQQQQIQYKSTFKYLNQDEEIIDRQIKEYEEEQKKKHGNQIDAENQNKRQNQDQEQIQGRLAQSESSINSIKFKKELKRQKELELIHQQLQKYRTRQIVSLSEIESCIDIKQRQQLCSLGQILPKYQVTEEYVIERKKLKELHDNAIPVLDTDFESSFLAIKRDLHIKCHIKKIKQIQAKQNNYINQEAKNQLIDERLKNIYNLE